MKKGSYIWVVLVGLIEIGVTLGIFSGYYDSSFETKVLAILVIIYTTIRVIGMGLGQGVLGLSYQVGKNFKELKELQGFTDTETAEIEKDELDELLNKIKKTETTAIINTVIIAIMYLIAVVNLIGSL